LTQLPNRTLFAERTQRALDRARASGLQVAVLFVDLDGFKTINDSLGHAVGDQLLVELSARLLAASTQNTLVARLGGDEFAILVEEVDDPATPKRLAESTLRLIGRPTSLAEREVVVNASIGIATNTAEKADADELLRNADMAMYTAKRAGKGRYAVFEDSMRGVLLGRVELEAELRRAVDQHEFVVHYQPVLALDVERIIGVEALVRWQHPQRGLLAPSEFIGLAEETGLIIPLGGWVLRQACEDVARWQRVRPAERALQLSVNLSIGQLQDPDFGADLTAAVHDTGLAPGSLVLEITESVFMRDTALNNALLQDLRQRGALLAIDDFGTGYSSLGYLLSFPVDVLKIDRAFIEHIATDASSLALTRAIVSLGPRLNLRVIAKCIEQPAQAELLRTLHVDAGQGFYFAHPQEAAQLAALLDRPFLNTALPGERAA
jgi:diguanylate cyclase (GGDEF)-like protein